MTAGWLLPARSSAAASETFQVAALAQAIHDALVSLVPSQQSTLDSDLAATLASLPSGKAKNRGIEVGKAQAANVLAQRGNDGLDTASVDIPFATPAAIPGNWQPTPPTFHAGTRAGQGDAEALPAGRQQPVRSRAATEPDLVRPT